MQTLFVEFLLKELCRKEEAGLHIDVGKRRVTSHSFLTELSSIGGMRFLSVVWGRRFGPSLVQKHRPYLGYPCWKTEGSKHPFTGSWRLGLSVKCRVSGYQLLLLTNLALLKWPRKRSGFSM